MQWYAWVMIAVVAVAGIVGALWVVRRVLTPAEKVAEARGHRGGGPGPARAGRWSRVAAFFMVGQQSSHPGGDSSGGDGGGGGGGSGGGDGGGGY